MIDPIGSSISVAASGLDAQATRLRVVSENIANAQSTGTTPGSDAYRRKTLSFENEIDALSGAAHVKIAGIERSDADFRVEHNPDHPAADAQGYVKLPNVNVLIEMADMREANRSYEANLQVIKQARDMISMTPDPLRGGT